MTDGFYEKLPPGIKRQIPKPKEPIQPIRPPHREGYVPPVTPPSSTPSAEVSEPDVPPSKPPEPEITEDWSGITKPTQSLEVTYESRRRELISIGIPVKDLQKHQQDIIKRGGRIVKISLIL